MNIFQRIRLLDQRHETTRLLIKDLETRYLLLLRQVEEMRERSNDTR
jgi:hypothetical protein